MACCNSRPLCAISASLFFSAAFEDLPILPSHLSIDTTLLCTKHSNITHTASSSSYHHHSTNTNHTHHLKSPHHPQPTIKHASVRAPAVPAGNRSKGARSNFRLGRQLGRGPEARTPTSRAGGASGRSSSISEPLVGRAVRLPTVPPRCYPHFPPRCYQHCQHRQRRHAQREGSND